jgi:hypothetical protein
LTFLPEQHRRKRTGAARYTDAKPEIVHGPVLIPFFAEELDQDFTAHMRGADRCGHQGRSPYATFGHRSTAMPRTGLPMG